jgi:hypothetical protein
MAINVTINVTLEEAVALINLVGDLPTSRGGYPLWVKLREQVEPILNAPAPPVAESD